MNNILSAVIFLSFFASCAGQQAGSELAAVEMEAASKDESLSADYLIGDNGVGCLAISGLLDEDCFRSEMDVKELQGIDGSRSYIFSKDDERMLVVFPALDPRTGTYTRIIRSISVMDSGFQSKEGLRVGSSREEFSRTYKKAFYYYDLASEEVVMTNEGFGPQFVLDAATLTDKKNTRIGRISKNQISPDAKIKEIRLIRSQAENNDAMINKEAEEREILEGFLATLEGKYYLPEYSERYYKIQELQGDFFVSECREGDCEERGKIIGAEITNGFIPLEMEGIEGEMVPTWTVAHDEESTTLYVHDYDAVNDEWVDEEFVKQIP